MDVVTLWYQFMLYLIEAELRSEACCFKYFVFKSERKTGYVEVSWDQLMSSLKSRELPGWHGLCRNDMMIMMHVF
jgi:hypothetical protein